MFWQLAFCNTDRIALCHFFIHLKYVKDFILKKKRRRRRNQTFLHLQKERSENVYSGKFIFLLFQNKNFILMHLTNAVLCSRGPESIIHILRRNNEMWALMNMRSFKNRFSFGCPLFLHSWKSVCVSGRSRGRSLEQLESRKSPSVVSSQWTQWCHFFLQPQ